MAVVIGQNHGFKPFVRRPPRCRLQSHSQQFDYNFFRMLNFDQQDNDHFSYSLKHSIQRSNNNLHRSASTPCLSPSFKLDEGYSDSSKQKVEIIGGNGCSHSRALVVEVAISLASGLSPEPVSSGLGGAYFLRSRNGARIAVVKPMDEEPLALNNPKGFAGGMLGQPGMKRSIRVGETCLRELAAYLLDHDGFSGVAPTALVRISHPAFHVNNDDSWERTTHPPCKIASLQRFADHDCDSGELGSSGFSISSVHRIGILDVRTLNLDRHAGNMLVKRGEEDESCTVGGAELIPIDHGFCLPDSLDDPYFEWLHWPQASIPFSPVEVEYISKLDPFKDAEILKSELPYISESSIRVLVVCTIFLKQAVVSGLCLADIGEMMTREFRGGVEEECSELESICMKAKETMRNRLIDDKVKAEMGGQVSTTPQVLNGTKVSFNRQLSDVSQTLQNSPSIGKPPKIPRFSSVDCVPGLDFTLSININSETNLIATDHDESDKVERASFPAFGEHGHGGDDLIDTTFGEMSDHNWEVFLEIFDEVLVDVLKGRKCMCLSKLGSCEF